MRKRDSDPHRAPTGDFRDLLSPIVCAREHKPMRAGPAVVRLALRGAVGHPQVRRTYLEN